MHDARDLMPRPNFFVGLANAAILLLVLAFCLGLVLLASGCATPGGDGSPTPAQVWDYATNRIDSALSGAGGASSQPTTRITGVADITPAGDCGDAAEPVSASPAADIDWRFGGFNGAKAAEDPATQIRDLKFSGDGLSYKWARGDLGNWGLADTDAGAIAAAFYWDGSRWVGGKFDWISTSRLTRSFTNIREGYHGWDYSAFSGASRRAFCIVSKDGRKRTNLIEEAR